MKIDKALLRRFSRGECNGEEAGTVKAYFDMHPGELENCFPLYDWLCDNKGHLDHIASERILHQVRLIYEQEKQVSITKTLLRYAVAAALIGTVIFGGLKLLTKREKNTQKSTFLANSHAEHAQTSRTIENSTNDVTMVSLPDGSLVTMYPGSSLNYLPEFEKDKRELYLSGKALFKVSKDRSRPFTVYAGGIATMALGTLFLVSELRGRKVSIALLEGSIKVWPKKSERADFVILQPGDKLVVSNEKFNSYTLEKRIKENAQHAQGKVTANKKENNTMAFKNDRLSEVFKKIGGKFEVTINIGSVSDIEKRSFTGIFLENDSLEFICRTICNLHGYQYRKDGNIITISNQ